MTTTVAFSSSEGRIPPYELTVDDFPDDYFRVVSFTGKEALSASYRFDVTVLVTPDGADIARQALRKRARFVWNRERTSRAYYGVIASVRVEPLGDAEASIKAHLSVVPRLWLLKHVRRSRIYQNMRVPDVVTSVLEEAGIGVRWQLSRAYPIREYCTQYEETNYDFVRRLLAEVAIYFYFAQGSPVDPSALAAASVIGEVGSLASAAVGSVAGAAVGFAASAATSLIPGDTVIFGDDADFYPPLGPDDVGELGAASAAALAPVAASAMGEALFGMSPIGEAALGQAASAVGDAIARLTARKSPRLYYVSMLETTRTHADKITRFELQNSVQSNAANFRDYDPSRPAIRLNSTSVSSTPFPPSPLEQAAAVTAQATNLTGALSASPLRDAAAVVAGGTQTVVNAIGNVTGQSSAMLEIYDHHGPFLFPKWPFALDEAPRILRQARRRASVATAASGCSELAPGHRFALSDHPVSELDHDYVVTKVEHRGQLHPEPGEEWRVYWNSFECTPAEVTYVPKKPKRKSVQVMLTATVVGPPGQEICVDELGQIKVQFHWDREGAFEDKSSCWIRVMHAWGGAGWGAQFIPRVGMEVVVGFDGGDPDKPLVLGCVYNGIHPPPFVLPGDKTRSGWRTQSSPGGGGFNEISFEDAAREEQIYLHAQRNLDEVVEKNHTLLVKNEERIEVLANRIDIIQKNLEEHVFGDYASHVDGSRMAVVLGNADERISGTLVTRVEGRERRAIRGPADLEYADDMTTRVQGCMTTVVGKADKKRSWVTYAEGTAELFGTASTQVASEKEVILGVGKSSIRITEDKIELTAGSITVKGAGGGVSASEDGLALSSKGDAQMIVGKKLVLKTSSASLAMENQVKIDGTQILLNSPEQAKDPPPKEPDPPTSIELLEESGAPLAHQRFVVVLDDGSEVAGMTGKDGKVELSLTSGGKIVFPELKDVKVE